jgi:hypothetical protein
VKRAEEAEILRFYRDQNAPDNQLLAPAPLRIPLKYGLPLPYVIARKTRGRRGWLPAYLGAVDRVESLRRKLPAQVQVRGTHYGL